MNINIHLIRTQRPHWGAYSGINQFLKYVNPQRYNIEVYIASDSDDDFPIRNKLVRRGLRYLVQRKGMMYYKLSDLTAETRALRKCWRKRVDIIHYIDGEHSAQYLPWLCKLPRRLRPMIVATFHQTPEFLGSLTRREVISRLDFVTVVSPHQVPYFSELLPADKICSILHGIDTNFFRPGNNSIQRNKFKCITVGHWRRDFNVVLAVAQKLSSHRDIEFHVVTSKLTGPRLTGLENQPNIKLYRDNLDDVQFLEKYREADVLFLPLLESTANNALLEGIACGLPVLSTLLPSVNAYVPGKEAILVEGNDPQKFVDAISHLASNREYLKIMGYEARKRAEELDWRNIAPQYEEVYFNLASN
jgi:glycosyltransferase involved in cell wall biosynthesis